MSESSSLSLNQEEATAVIIGKKENENQKEAKEEENENQEEKEEEENEEEEEEESVPDPPDLPAGWSSVWDATSSKYYYWNQSTGLVTWTIPNEQQQNPTPATSTSTSTSSASASASASAAHQPQYYQPHQYYQYAQQQSYDPGYSGWHQYSSSAGGEADSLAHFESLMNKIDSQNPAGTKRKATAIDDDPTLNSEKLFGKEETLPESQQGVNPAPSTGANWWEAGAGYAAQAAFNKKTGKMQALGFDETHYSYASKAHRQMSAFFDVETWEQQRQQQQPKKAAPLSKKALQQVLQEQKEKKKRNQTNWLLND